MFDGLSRADRLLLLKLLCSFARADKLKTNLGLA
jgi:hypothetical protein